MEENYRAHQIARLLLNRAEQWCLDNGYRYVQFAVLPELDAAINLADRMNYEIKDKRSAFDNRDSEDSILYWKDLRASHK